MRMVTRNPVSSSTVTIELMIENQCTYRTTLVIIIVHFMVKKRRKVRILTIPLFSKFSHLFLSRCRDGLFTSMFWGRKEWREYLSILLSKRTFVERHLIE